MRRKQILQNLVYAPGVNIGGTFRKIVGKGPCDAYLYASRSIPRQTAGRVARRAGTMIESNHATDLMRPAPGFGDRRSQNPLAGQDVFQSKGK